MRVWAPRLATCRTRKAVREQIKPVLADGTLASGRDPRSITIARSVYGRSSGGPKTDLVRALDTAAEKAAALNINSAQRGEMPALVASLAWLAA